MNAIQPSLFEIQPTVTPKYAREATIQERFDAFHRANPAVYAALRALAFDLRRRGIRRFGIKALFEQLRWLYALQTQGEDYKLSNDFSSRYARLLMKQEAELSDFFECRELRERGCNHD